MSAWKDYASIDKEKYGIKKNSLPIIYHGNYNKYRESLIRILTADLNPPNDEFPDYNPSIRYREISNYTEKAILSKYDAAKILETLNSYYTRNSNPWYDHFEPILNGINASYYGVMENTVLHTNILTPLSLTWNWSNYNGNSPKILDGLIKHGHSKWLKLMDILQPDMIISSIGDKYRKGLFAGQELSWTRIENITTSNNGKKRRKPYQVQCAIVSLGCGKKTLLVFGDKSAVPFMISQEHKIMIGNKILKLMSRIYSERKTQNNASLQVHSGQAITNQL